MPDNHIRFHAAKVFDMTSAAWQQRVTILCLGFRRGAG